MLHGVVRKKEGTIEWWCSCCCLIRYCPVGRSFVRPTVRPTPSAADAMPKEKKKKKKKKKKKAHAPDAKRRVVFVVVHRCCPVVRTHPMPPPPPPSPPPPFFNILLLLRLGRSVGYIQSLGYVFYINYSRSKKTRYNMEQQQKQVASLMSTCKSMSCKERCKTTRVESSRVESSRVESSRVE